MTLLVMAVAGSVYVWTLLPGVGFDGDTSKFQFVGSVLGTPHPTGYPTYLLLNHFFTRSFPIGSLAWRANLLSAVFGAAALALMFRTLRLLEVARTAALSVVLVFAFIPTVWTYAIVAEVYTLHLLCVAGVVHLLILWRRTRADRWLLLAGGVVAVSFGNHMTTLLVVPAFLFLVAVTQPRAFIEPGKLAAALGAVLLAALPYTYLIWRTRDPSTPYLEVAAPDVASLWGIVTGGSYQSVMFRFSLAEILTVRVPLILSRILWEFLFVTPLAVLGLLRLRDRAVTAFLVVLFMANALWAIGYDVRDYYVFLIPSFFVLGLLAALGLDQLASGATPARRWAVGSLGLLLPIAFVWINGGEVSQRHNVRSAQTVEEVLAAVGRDAIIITPEYRISEYFWYYLIGEGMASRNLHILYDYSRAKVEGYLLKGEPWFNLIERRTVPVGLKVYCIPSIVRRDLLEAGFMLQPVMPGLDRVEPPASPASLPPPTR